MAVWQFHLTVIPKKGIVEKLGFIPDALPFNQEEFVATKQEYSTKEWIDSKKQWAKTCWFLTDIHPLEIIHQVDKYVKRMHDDNDLHIWWKTYTNEKDNDAGLIIDANTGKIEELSFRADLRETDLKFLKDMMQLAHLYDWLLVDMTGNIAEPNRDAVKKLIVRSNAYKFLTNPEAFLADIVKNQIN